MNRKGIIINKDTKKARRIIAAYNNSTKADIFEAYKVPSSTKIKSFQFIKKEMEEEGGKDIRITGAGTDNYSCAYRVFDGTNWYLIYYTKINRFIIQL